MVKIWSQAYEQNSNIRINHYAHSAGCAYPHLALEICPPELRACINYVAIAPAAYTSKKLCASVRHYASSRDVVPLVDFQGRSACRNTMTV